MCAAKQICKVYNWCVNNGQEQSIPKHSITFWVLPRDCDITEKDGGGHSFHC